MLAHGSRQPRSWLIFNVRQDMNSLETTLMVLCVSAPVCSCVLACALWFPNSKWRQRFHHALGAVVLYSSALGVGVLITSRVILWREVFGTTADIAKAAAAISTQSGRSGQAIDRLWHYTRDSDLDAGIAWVLDTGSLFLVVLCFSNAVVAAWNRNRPNQALEPTPIAVTDPATQAPRQP